MEQKICVIKDNRPNRKKPWLARWWGEYDPRTGKQRRYSKSFTLKKDAVHFAEEKETEFKAGMPRDQKDITIGQLCHKFMANRTKSLMKSSRKGYNETITQLKNHFASTVSIKRIRAEDAEEFISNLEPTDPHYLSKGKQFSDSSIARHFRQAKKIFSTAQEWGYLKKNPFEDIKLGKIRKKPWHYVTVPQFNALIDHTNNLKDKALYGILYWVGLRYGEAANLMWNGRNLDFEKNQIYIFNRPGTETIPPFNVKDYEARTVPMNKWVVNMLKELHSKADEKCPFVFLIAKRWELVQARWQKFRKTGKGRDWENRYMINGVLRNFKARCIRAGIKTDLKLNLHGLRKSWATNLANSGKVPMHTLQMLGGWAKIQTCEEFYLQNDDANTRRACDVLNELAGGGGFCSSIHNT